jgi:hypothetical protein
MAVREALNAILIEDKSGRVSQVPIDPTETIMQGDMMKWDAAAHRCTKMAAAADGALFVGVSDHTNPQYTAGTLTTNYTTPYTNIVQSALVRMIAGKAETLYGYDTLEMITDAQHVQKTATAANIVGVVDPGWATVAGKTVAIGDEIKLWLKIPKLYAAFSGAQ